MDLEEAPAVVIFEAVVGEVVGVVGVGHLQVGLKVAGGHLQEGSKGAGDRHREGLRVAGDHLQEGSKGAEDHQEGLKAVEGAAVHLIAVVAARPQVL